MLKITVYWFYCSSFTNKRWTFFCDNICTMALKNVHLVNLRSFNRTLHNTSAFLEPFLTVMACLMILYHIGIVIFFQVLNKTKCIKYSPSLCTRRFQTFWQTVKSVNDSTLFYQKRSSSCYRSLRSSTAPLYINILISFQNYINLSWQTKTLLNQIIGKYDTVYCRAWRTFRKCSNGFSTTVCSIFKQHW